MARNRPPMARAHSRNQIRSSGLARAGDWRRFLPAVVDRARPADFGYFYRILAAEPDDSGVLDAVLPQLLTYVLAPRHAPPASRSRAAAFATAGDARHRRVSWLWLSLGSRHSGVL